VIIESLDQHLICFSTTNIVQHICCNLSDIHVVIFEEFLSDKEKVIMSLIEFLDLDFNDLPRESLDIHSNKAVLPKYIKVQILKNRLVPEAGKWLYRKHFKPFSDLSPKKKFVDRLIHNTNSAINPLIESKTPKIDEQSKRFLEDHFKNELKGINEILNKDVLKLWGLDDKS